MAQNRALIFKAVPDGLPVAGRDLVIEPAAYGPDGACLPNGIFVQTLYHSLDPYQRGPMRAPNIKSYRPPYPLQPTHHQPCHRQEYVAIDESSLNLTHPLHNPGLNLVHLLHNPYALPDIRVFLSALGMPGLTGYSGFYEIGKPQHGDTIFISAASGAVGQMVGQLARLEGLRTIGSVGSDDKLKFIVETLGFDAGFNYKKEQPGEALARLAPEGLDIYYDNVGGEHLDAALQNMKDFGRVVVCGAIGDLIFSKRLTVRGFVVADEGFGPKYGEEHQERVGRWIKEGEMKTVLWEVEGMENAVEGFLAMFQGRNFGKVVLKY
ncbi:hypothetical protein B0T14DRAFT_537306 [Immersiella caudata]|uniref:Dehydrogenase FUB6 n=1 Tax=Immersiella caudata TaxID=314043 RepID=A0AA40BZW5_9PEZI|nr:hypothetical protein B0T14DRAFT_537306 [Immersiella caudata]